MSKLPKYVLITPARNEAELIAGTIESVVAQSVRPEKWVIVSDGSTDGTDDIVKRYMAEHPWIELVRTPERQERHFAGKVYAFNAGYERVKGTPYDVVASLDADITFDPDYFVFLLEKLVEDLDRRRAKVRMLIDDFRKSTRAPFVNWGVKETRAREVQLLNVMQPGEA